MPDPTLSELLLPRVAVIGAGVGGLACARRLVDAGLHPVVFERQRVPGGRCAARRTEAGVFDHGVQDLAAHHPEFHGQLHFWVENGMASAWTARVVRLSPHGATEPVAGRRYVGVPSMETIGQDLARGVELNVDCAVRSAIRDAQGKWFLELRRDERDQTEGPFDAVLVAVAADQAVPLLAEAPEFRAHAESARNLPIWTLLLAYGAALDVPFDVALPEDPVVAWLARDSSKPYRAAGERWVAHAAPDWSLARVDDAPDAVRAALLAAFERLTRQNAVPAFAAVHLWRYGVALTPAPPRFLWDQAAGIGACGDWLGQDRLEPGAPGTLESAWMSGDALGQRVARGLLGRVD